MLCVVHLTTCTTDTLPASQQLAQPLSNTNNKHLTWSHKHTPTAAAVSLALPCLSTHTCRAPLCCKAGIPVLPAAPAPFPLLSTSLTSQHIHLIQHQCCCVAEVEAAALNVAQQAARCRHQHINTSIQRLNLWGHTHAHAHVNNDSSAFHQRTAQL